MVDDLRACNGADDPRERCGLHHCTDTGNMFGGYTVADAAHDVQAHVAGVLAILERQARRG